jgi:hypothetical protein
MLNYAEIFKTGLTYDAYRNLIDKLLAEGKTTGPDNSEAMLNYSKMNVQRMKRVDKTLVLNEKLSTAIKNLEGNYKFLVITEGWCGDASQIVPVFNKMAIESTGKIELKLILRDENLPLMDAYLTNGGRAIPILLILDEKAENVLAKWGPRPSAAQELLINLKKEETDIMVISEKLHGWYAKDKTQSVQKELFTVLNGI